MTDSLPPTTLTLWLRRLPFLAILVAAVIALIFFRHYISFDMLERNREKLIDLRDHHYFLTSAIFLAIYVLVVISSVPGALFLTMTGGFLFGMIPGAIYNVLAATVGAITVFQAARMGFGHGVAARIEAQGGTVGKLQAALKENQWAVLLTMRLIPVLPFFITNIVPAFVGVRFSTFAITTFIGIIPADFIYTLLGSGLGDVFARGEVPHFDILMRPEFALPLLGLMLLAAAPLLLKFIGRKKG